MTDEGADVAAGQRRPAINEDGPGGLLVLVITPRCASSKDAVAGSARMLGDGDEPEPSADRARGPPQRGLRHSELRETHSLQPPHSRRSSWFRFPSFVRVKAKQSS